MPNAGPRLPFQPLMDAAGELWVTIDTNVAERNRHAIAASTYDRQVGASQLLAEMIGVSRRSIVRYRKDGIPWEVADRAAAALGKHPSEVWGNLWYEVTNR